MKFQNKYKLLISGLLLFLASCGDPAVTVDESQFTPKIAVEAYLYTGEPVNNIKIMRNFPLATDIDSLSLFLHPDVDNVEISINDIDLNFDPVTQTYYKSEMYIEENKPYTLKVSANIDGIQLSTSSTTITPKKGFEFREKNLGTFKYGTNKPLISFNTSPDIDFYAFSAVPESASVESFIYDNSLFPDLDPEDVEDEFNRYSHQAKYITNINIANLQEFSFTLEDYDSWFYGPYHVIGYAGDKNFRDFAFTSGNVQEFDGNFHEPLFHFEGDGIGVFGSAVRDTLYFKLVK